MIRIRKIAIVIVLALISCKTKSSEVGGNEEIMGKLLLEIPVSSFFSSEAINPLPSGESSLKYLIPTTLFVESGNFYIPDRSRSEIKVIGTNGRTVSSYKMALSDFCFYKLGHWKKKWYALDVNSGLIIFDEKLNVLHRDASTVNIYFDKPSDNVYTENVFNNKRAIIDQKGILDEPLVTDYLSTFVDNQLLTGLQMETETRWRIEKVDLRTRELIEEQFFVSECGNCLIIPSLLNERLILNSTENPVLLDEITRISENTEVSSFTLRYPIEIDTLINSESAGYTYSGFFYYYSSSDGILYSISTDENFIRIFSFDIASID